LKLLLDVHHSPVAGERRRPAGHDVVVAADNTRLAVMADDDLLRWARDAGRALVTENARDFDRIARAWGAAGESHRGIVLTSPRRFHRGRASYPRDLIASA